MPEEDAAPSASMDRPKAQAAPAQLRAPPPPRGGSPWPPEPASAISQWEDSPLLPLSPLSPLSAPGQARLHGGALPSLTPLLYEDGEYSHASRCGRGDAVHPDARRHRPARAARGRRPLRPPGGSQGPRPRLRPPERRLRRVEARRGPHRPPRAAPRLRNLRHCCHRGRSAGGRRDGGALARAGNLARSPQISL